MDLSAFNVQEKRPGLVRRIKELQPAASNRAIASAIGVSEFTVRNDQKPPEPAAARHLAPEPEPDEVEAEPEPADGEALPAFMGGDGWAMPERQREAWQRDKEFPLVAGLAEPE